MVDPSARAARAGISAEELSELRPYVVNLTQGQFSSGGRYQTTRADVDAIFDVHLPAAVQEHGGGPLPVAVWAHGGLISENSGLQIARNQVDWWRRNGAYPLHFVWESGFLDALQETVRAALPGFARDIWDYTTDPLIEAVGRSLGSRLWLAMKTSAALSSAAEGGARYVAERLAAFTRDNPSAVTVHLIGHSAGAIFHAHFLPTLLDQGLQRVETLQFLAPAVRVDEFLTRLAGRVGSGIGDLVVYTMRRELERDDNCIGVYHKSLLYLVQRSFESGGARILGLEDSLLADDRLVDLFGLGRGHTGKATIVWSKTESGPLDSRSTSTSHGGFDNDPATMESVARRVTGRTQIHPLPSNMVETGRRLWVQAGTRPPAAAPPTAPISSTTVAGAPLPVRPSVDGIRRRALCVGINAYPEPYRLEGCVADARMWADRLTDRGFEVDLLLDEQATREAILGGLGRLIAMSAPGDVLAFQYSGHGTEVDDLDGDEIGGTNGPYDEALCPVDYEDGRLLIDDDLRRTIDSLPEEVALTTFLDCCHSGSGARFGAPRFDLGGGQGDRRLRVRRIPATPELQARHAAFRRTVPAMPLRGRGLTRSAAHDVLFSACKDYEVAYESEGQGDFTRYAATVLASGIPLATNGDFVTQVLARFGAARRQTPELDQAERTQVMPFRV